MRDIAYVSDMSPWWPSARQEAVLGAAVPGWPDVTVWRDTTTNRQRRLRRTESLAERAAVLRILAGSGQVVCYAASLLVLAYSPQDLCVVMDGLNRGAAVVALDDQVRLDADSDRDGAAAAWRAASTRARSLGSSRHAAAVAAANRTARVQAACQAIGVRWRMPSSRHPTAALLTEACVSLNAAKKHLGPRGAAACVPSRMSECAVP